MTAIVVTAFSPAAAGQALKERLGWVELRAVVSHVGFLGKLFMSPPLHRSVSPSVIPLFISSEVLLVTPEPLWPKGRRGGDVGVLLQCWQWLQGWLHGFPTSVYVVRRKVRLMVCMVVRSPNFVGMVVRRKKRIGVVMFRFKRWLVNGVVNQHLPLRGRIMRNWDRVAVVLHVQ